MSGLLANWLDFFKANKEAFEGMQSLFTTLAIVVGGLWTYQLFVKKREKFPKASLTQVVSFWRLSEKRRLVRVSLTVKNEGEVLLKIPSGFVWIQQMKPWPEELLSHQPKKQEIAWPLIAERGIEQGYEVEPKEIEILSMDFVIDDVYEQILVYSFIKNDKKRDKGWMTTTIVDFEAEEKAQRHIVMSDQHGIPDKHQDPSKGRPQPVEQPPRRIQEQGRPKERPNPATPPEKKGN